MKKCVCIGAKHCVTPGFCIEHPWTAYQRKVAVTQLYSTYASTEMQSSFTECSEFHGTPATLELIIVEFLDDKNLPGESRRNREKQIYHL